MKDIIDMKDFKKHIEGLIKYHRVGHGIALGVASCLLFILVATILIGCPVLCS